MSKMELIDWGVKVKPHLDFIGSGAAMAARHARMLPCRPDFEALAEGDLAKTRSVLEAALQDVIAAQETYARKPVDA